MLDWLLDPWSDPLGTRALVEVLLLGATGGALGCWIVFYRLAYSAESLAHALLPGLVLAALAGGLTALVLGALVVLHPSLLVVGFDRSSARALGRAPLAIDVALGVLVALAILVAVQGLGNLLVVAVLVGPAAAARRLTRRVPTMMAAAVAIAVVSGVAGLYASFYLDTAGGASIAGALVLAYAAAHLAGGLVRRA